VSFVVIFALLSYTPNWLWCCFFDNRKVKITKAMKFAMPAISVYLELTASLSFKKAPHVIKMQEFTKKNHFKNFIKVGVIVYANLLTFPKT
jgi:hypothetical protein